MGKASFVLFLLSIGPLWKSICFDKSDFKIVIGVTSVSFAKCLGNDKRKFSIQWIMQGTDYLDVRLFQNFFSCFPSVAHNWSFPHSLVSLPEGWKLFETLSSDAASNLHLSWDFVFINVGYSNIFSNIKVFSSRNSSWKSFNPMLPENVK